MRRRDFIKVISGSAVVWPLAARAQRSNVPHVGYLFPFTETASQQLWEACRLGLHELGYSEGHNIILVPRWAEEQYEKLPTLVSELLRLNVDVIVTASTPAALVAKSATKTTPILFVAVADPRERRSCRDPRATRRECNRVEPFDIRFERQASSFAQGNCSQNLARCNSNESGQPIQRYFPGRNEACLSTVRYYDFNRRMRIHAKILKRAFAVAAAQRADALIVFDDPVLFGNRAQIAALAAARRIPTIYGFREFVMDGGLISYGPDRRDQYRKTAIYVDKILKGAKPADLPVQQPVKFDLAINRRAAVCADEVIE